MLLLNKQTVAADQFQPNATGVGNIVVGNEGGAATLRWGQFANVDQIYGLSNVAVTTSGALDLATNHKTEWINALSLETGKIQ